MTKPEDKEPKTLSELRDAVAEHRKTLRSCDTQKTAVAWMTRAHELMGVCMDRLAEKAKEPSPIIMPQRPQLVVVNNMREVLREVVARGPGQRPGWFDPKVKTVIYPVRPDPPPGSVLAPKAWTHVDTLRLERAVRDKPNMQKLTRWAERKMSR